MSDNQNALADRCEGASGPDRYLDLSIHACVKPSDFEDDAEARMYATDAYQRVMNRADWYYVNSLTLPAYTASLDAAKTLVPEGASWSLYDVIGKRESVRMYGDGFDVLCAAATPALALCAAALRSRSTRSSSDAD